MRKLPLKYYLQKLAKMKHCIKMSLSLIIIGCLFSGCASLISGSRQKVKISSSPDNANVVIFNQDNVQVFNSSTPAVVRLKRGDGFFSGAEYRVEINKDGYGTQTLYITSDLNAGWYIVGNFFLGGLIGWIIVDPLTGGMWNLSPKNINANLQQRMSFDVNGNVDGIYIVLKEQIPEDIFNNLELLKIN